MKEKMKKMQSDIKKKDVTITALEVLRSNLTDRMNPIIYLTILRKVIITRVRLLNNIIYYKRS